MAESNFIEAYSNFILESIPTQREWAESIAYAILSVPVGPDRYVLTAVGPLKLNVWFLNIGPSGLANKTAPLKYFALPTLAKLTEKIDYPVIMPSRYSIEGLIEYLAKGFNMGIIIRDEFTSMFKESGKEYLRDMLEFLSELYDGTVQKRYTRKAKLEEAQRVYISFLGATTPYLFKILKPEWFMQGTGNRILYILFDKTITPEEIEEFDLFANLERVQTREDEIEKWAEKLKDIHYMSIQQLIPDDEAQELINDFRKRIWLEASRLYASDIYNIKYTYYVRLPELALKIAGLNEIADKYLVLSKTKLPSLLISEENMKKAIDRVLLHRRYFEKMLEIWSLKPNPVEGTTIEELARVVVDLLNEAGANGMSWSELRKKTKWTNRTWREVIQYLWDTEQIVICRRGSSVRKRDIRFFSKLYEVAGLQYGAKIYDWSTALLLLKLQ